MPGKCRHDGCTKRPTFGVSGSNEREFCSAHKKDGMVNVSSKRCGQSGCARHPHFGIAGSNKRKFCSAHKKDGMVDVGSKRCGHPGCSKRPSFGVAGSSRKKEFCSAHKKDGMVDVGSKRCGQSGCTRHPIYGIAGSKNKEFCSKHKKDGMVDVVSKRCGHSVCSRWPSFRVAGSGARYCLEHAEEGMVKIRRFPSLPGGGGMNGKKHGRGNSARGAGGTTLRGRANKRARQTPANTPVSPTPVGSAAGESPTPAEDGWLRDSGASVVKMETGLFEGRPRGGFQSRRKRITSSSEQQLQHHQQLQQQQPQQQQQQQQLERTAPAAEVGRYQLPDAAETPEEGCLEVSLETRKYIYCYGST